VKNKFLVNSLLFLMIGGVSSVAWGMDLNVMQNNAVGNDDAKYDQFFAAIEKNIDIFDRDGYKVGLQKGCDLIAVFKEQSEFITKRSQDLRDTLANNEKLTEDINSLGNDLDAKKSQLEEQARILNILENGIRTVFALKKEDDATKVNFNIAARDRLAGDKLFWLMNQMNCGNLFTNFFAGILTKEQENQLFFETIPTLVEDAKLKQWEEETNVLTKHWVKHERKYTFSAILVLIACLIYQNYGNDIQNIFSGMSPSQSV
jgi:hypothetical protein